MRACTAPVGELLLEVDAATKFHGAIGVEVDVEDLEVGGGVQDGDVASLDEVVAADEMFLVGGHLAVVRADSWLDLIGVVEALDVV